MATVGEDYATSEREAPGLSQQQHSTSQTPISVIPARTARKPGPSTALTVGSAVCLVIVLALSAFIANRDKTEGANPTQFALSGALQSADHIYKANSSTFPQGDALVSRLHRNDSELSFAFGPQYVVSSVGGSQYTATGISVAVSANGQVIMFAVPGNNKTCWYATDNHQPNDTVTGLNGADPESGVTYAMAGGQPDCTAGTVLPTNVTDWQKSWPS